MNKTVCYPAVFHPEEVGYSVTVPDFEQVDIGCFTCGDTFEEACAMAFDAIGLCVDTVIEDKKEFPIASKPENLEREYNDFIVPIVVDMEKYHRSINNKSVRKNVSIPAWMDELATEKNLSLSKLLQKAIAEELGISQ